MEGAGQVGKSIFFIFLTKALDTHYHKRVQRYSALIPSAELLCPIPDKDVGGFSVEFAKLPA
jgi:hypothetical protein